MHIPLSWIKEFTPLTADTSDIVAALDQAGLEVEGVHEPGKEISGVVVAKVLNIAPHPNADELHLVDIEFGSGQTQVVCGGTNLYEGMITAYAPTGATLPGGFTLTDKKIRGVVSPGMLAASHELGLPQVPGRVVIELPKDAPIGSDVRDVLGLNDTIFEIAITPNRPDAMSMIGVARELSAAFGVPLTVKSPKVSGDPSWSSSRGSISVAIEDTQRCPRFVARAVGVQVGPSPAWIAQRLSAAGMRPINNVVDATNYVMLERGNPLHAFDLAKLAGPGVIIRTAKNGEQLTTLDGVERTLIDQDLVVSDADRVALDIAGIMGGESSEINDTTTEILLTAAYFTPMGISKSSKRLGLRTEASSRFERGIDPNGEQTTADRACEILEEIAGAKVAKDLHDVYPTPIEPARIEVRTERVNKILGINLTAKDVKNALEPLELKVSGKGDVLTVVCPTFRPDLEREIDLIEEVARRVGLDSIPRTRPSVTNQVGHLTDRQRMRRLVVDTLVGAGCYETTTVPWVNPEDLAKFGYTSDSLVHLTNALRAEDSTLRPAIVPGLLMVAAYNTSQGLSDIRLGEVGHVFAPPVDKGPLPLETEHVAVLLTGNCIRSPHEPDRPIDIYDAIDVWNALTTAVGIANPTVRAATAPGYHATRTANLFLDDKPAGIIGELSSSLTKSVGIDARVMAFEIDLDALLHAEKRDRSFQAPSRFPMSRIDLAFVVSADEPAGEIVATIRRTVPDELEEVWLFDRYEGETLGEGKVSLAFALRFRSADRTLTDDDVAKLRQRCIDAVVREHSAQPRT